MNTSTESFHQSTFVDSIVKERRETITKLLELGCPPIPVSPAFSVEEYATEDGKPKFNGKNPSYLDKQGKPHEIKHSRYNSQLPTQTELDKWFVNPATGVGTLGGFNNIYWGDLDRKHFESQEDCDQWVTTRSIKGWLEQTQSGGYRFPVRLKEEPGFTNFANTPGGEHIGELVGKSRFVVLAPTVGSKGIYRVIQQGNPIELNSLEDIGIYPARSEASPPTVDSTQVDFSKSTVGCVSLFDCCVKRVQDLFTSSVDEIEDRSKDIADAAKELYGWENWLKAHQVSFKDTSQEWVEILAQNLEVDAARLSRILKTVDPLSCKPACVYRGGDDSAWKRVNKLLKVEIEQTEASESSSHKHFNQIAFEALYTKECYICHRGNLHKWNGTHYEKIEDELEQSRIARFCDEYLETVKRDGILQKKHTKATYKSVTEVLNWAKSRLCVNPKLVNPPGLNCANGVLKLVYNSIAKQFDFEFSNHSPDVYYTYVSEGEYNPTADKTQANKLMECLDPEQGEILLRTLAASLDLETVRKLHGGRVRALLAYGEGENGKDTIRVVMQRLLSQGVTGVAISAFKTYDQGKKFPVAPLEHSRLNWSSENSGNIVIDEVQSLKQAITGDTLACERKNQNEYDFEPKSVFIFNVNKLPTIVGNLHAIRSRYGILSFYKRFTLNPNKPNEIKADPRFKHDTEFIRTDVLPGFLNLLLEALNRLVLEGIDYTPLDETFDETRKKSSHLYDFCEDLGLVESPGEVIPSSFIWERLKQWYLDEGLAHENMDGTLRFQKMEHWSDEAVTCSNHLTSRLKQIFPDIESKKGGKGVRQIVGLSFDAPKTVEEVQDSLSSAESNPVAKTVVSGDLESCEYEIGDAIEYQQLNGKFANGYKVESIEGDGILNLIRLDPHSGQWRQAVSVHFSSKTVRKCKPKDDSPPF